MATADAGLSVVVFEKTSIAQFRSSEIGVINGKFVESTGAHFDESAYLDAALRDAQYRCDPALWKTWIANCGAAVD